MSMSKAMALEYTLARGVALCVAVWLLARARSEIAILQPRYWRWLLTPWKMATAAISCAALVLAAPFTGDPDWDAGVALLMSVLTFATAPWAIAELWRRRSWSRMFVALCTWQLSASWVFDGYWYARRGFYPDNWLGNLVASSMLYLAAGVLWNLDAAPLRLAFLGNDWPPDGAPAPFRRVAAPAILLMALAGAAVFIPFLFLPT
jgi:hypothetical protein